MITIKLTDTNPMPVEGMAVKLASQTLPEFTPTTVIDYCYCENECKYSQKVFAHTDGNKYKNDNKEFLFRKFISTDTVVMKLYKNNIEVATLNDNTLGVYYDGFSGGSADQQLYIGYWLEWNKVFTIHGVGEYVVKTELNIMGNTVNEESDTYNLMVYSDITADGTVRIDTVQNGNILGNPFDFTGLEWRQSMRVRGRFYEDSESFEKGAYQTQNYIQKQNQEKVIENWGLELNFVPRNVSEFLTKNACLSNEFKVSDYNLDSEKVFRDVSVYPEEIEKTRLENNRNSNYLIKFTSRFQGLTKRNF